jgi:hypothetical protein
MFLTALAAAAITLISSHAAPVTLTQCGGTGGATCAKYACIDAPWPGMKCPSTSLCTRRSASLWECVEGQASSSTLKPATAPATSPAPTAAPTAVPSIGPVCTFSQPNFLPLQDKTCASMNPSADNVFTDAVQSIQIPASSTLMLLCQGSIQRSTSSVADVKAACKGKKPLMWKVVGKSVVSYNHELMIFERTEPRDSTLKLKLSAAHIAAASDNIPPTVSFWMQWVSSGLVTLTMVPRVIKNVPATPERIDMTLLPDEIRTVLPMKGTYDGVLVYYTSNGPASRSLPCFMHTYRINATYDIGVSVAQAFAFANNGNSKSYINDELIPLLQQQWNYNAARRYIRGIFGQIQTFAVRRGLASDWADHENMVHSNYIDRWIDEASFVPSDLEWKRVSDHKSLSISPIFTVGPRFRDGPDENRQKGHAAKCAR